ncbi:DUF5979 domain-containing protein [Agromyces sp. NPDC058110]|uniref:DUF5979 domain-containing protein n=1 Tax=Agromyces sp. NPDC058110 TaxID=3346345 RepID=UPI0036DA457F
MLWALLAAGAVVAAPLATGPLAATAADGSVSGTVFQDYDSDGVFDPAPTDPAAPRERGLAGVTVTAYDAHDTAVGTAVSAADGTYTLSVTAAYTDQIRVQFTDLPIGMYPSFSVLNPSPGQSGSNVRITTLGATGIDFGVNAPDDYSGAGLDTPVVSPIVYAGQRQFQVNAANPEQGVSLAAYPWQTGSTSPSAANDFNFVNDGAYPGPYFGLPDGRTALATFDQTGALWATVGQKSTGDVFAASVLRRQVDFGPGGFAAIYRVPTVMDPATGRIGTPGAVETWLDLSTLGIDFGTFDTDYTARGLPYGNGNPGGFIRPQDPAGDDAAYVGAGKIGIGGMAISSDQSALYVMNLAQKRIEVIDIASKTLRTSIPLGLADADRPWALAVLHGRLVVGYIEDSTAAGIDGVKAVVRAAPESSPADLASPGSEVLRADLDYQKGQAFAPGSSTCAIAQNMHSCVWHPWRDTFDAAEFGLNDPTDTNIAWPQPILSDLALSADGDLVLGFADRMSFQIGYQNVAPFLGSAVEPTVAYQVFSAGDLLTASANPDGSFTLENDGTVGGKTTAGSTGPLPQGPGGAEFFNDSNVFATDVGRRDEHQENTTGGLAALPGADQILSSGYDTVSEFRTNGFAWFDTDDGQPVRGRMTSMPIEGSLAKAGGLGDVSALLQLAPLQIGNVAWYDADHDGLQDPDEPPVPGVTVELRDPAGTVIGTTTTDAAGQYYFSSAGSGGVNDTAGFVPGGGDYTVTFVKPTSGDLFDGDARFGTVPWSAVTFTLQGAGSDPTIDSDADPATGVVPYTAGGPGENDPNLDAGFYAETSFVVAKAAGDPQPLPGTYTLDIEGRDFRGDPYVVTPSTVTLPVGGSQTITGIPVGTQVQVTEATDPNHSVVVDPAGWVLVEGGSPVTTITATNTRVLPAGFDITKALYDPFGVVPSDTVYTGTWECTFEGGPAGSGTWQVEAGATTHVFDDAIRVGATCTIAEDPPSTTTDGDWQPSAVAPATVTLGPDGGDVEVVTVTNAFVVASTGFEILKRVEDPSGSVPAGTTYTGEWSCTFRGQPVGSGTWSLAADGTTVPLATDLPVGSECTVSEDPGASGLAGTWQRSVSGTVTLGPTGATVPVVTVTNSYRPPTPLPNTGVDATAPLAAGIALLAAGLLLAFGSRLRRRADRS